MANESAAQISTGCDNGVGWIQINSLTSPVPGDNIAFEITNVNIPGFYELVASPDITLPYRFSNIPEGVHTVVVFSSGTDGYGQVFVNGTLSPTATIDCVVQIPGCTNPDADNYDPAATLDNGTCTFTPQYHATGGVLPNPVYFQREFSTVVPGPTPAPKERHYITVNLYLPGAPEPFTPPIQQRIRNGIAKVDISRELRQGPLTIDPALAAISYDAAALYAYEIGYIETYNGVSQPEIRASLPQRYAVRAARQEMDSDLGQFVVAPNKTGVPFLTSFDEPVMFAGEAVHLAALIDSEMSAGNDIYLERSYYDAAGRLVERKTFPVFETGYVRFAIKDTPLPCAAYVEVVLTSEERMQAGECIDSPPTPPPPAGSVTIQDGAGNTLATVPAGGVFVIESGFSFGFRIL